MMLNIKAALLAFSLATLTLSAAGSQPTQIIKAWYNTTNWVTVPISFNEFEEIPAEMPLEQVEISFPNHPKIIREIDFQGSSEVSFQASDDEGMTYIAAASKIGQPYNSVAEMMENIIDTAKTHNKILAQQVDEDNTKACLAFVDKEGQVIGMAIFKGASYFYVLSNTFKNESYLGQLPMDDHTKAKMKNESCKIIAFSRSLKFLN